MTKENDSRTRPESARSARGGNAPSYHGGARRCVALPLGGIGTGHVSVCGDGALRQWQLHNRPNHLGYVPESFFAIRVAATEPPRHVTRVLRSARLEPPDEPAPNVNDHIVPFDEDDPTRHWPPVASTRFEGLYPFARIAYTDAELPVDVSLEAYTPFIPLEAEASSLPLASFTYTLTNRTDDRLHGWLLGTLQNTAGWDGATPIHSDRCSLYGGNVNRVAIRGRATAIVMENPSLSEDDPYAGDLALWSEAPCVPLPCFSRSQDALRFVETLKLFGLEHADDWSEAAVREACRTLPPLLGSPDWPSPPGQTWNGALAAAFVLEPRAETSIEFVIAWRFANRVADFDQFGVGVAAQSSPVRIGNHYATRFATSLHAIDEYAVESVRLRADSLAWADALAQSTLPAAVIEVLLAQPSLIRSPTTFLDSEGRLFGFEGCLGQSTLNWNGSLGGSCALNCTHVWNYEQAVSRLFPALERTMRETELLVSQAPEGYLPHRVLLPLTGPQLHGKIIGGPDRPALDGMLGSILKCYRELRQGASPTWLAEFWPRLVCLIGYIREQWDAGDGVLVGDQPVTYDISLHEPNMFVGSMWLAALRAMEEMAALVDERRAAEFRASFTAASTRYDELLYNGEYYGQRATNAPHEVGAGCLSDQLLGQWWAHQLELGYLLPVEHVRSALRAIVRHNLRAGFRDLVHGYRVFADGDDSGLLICTWPKGGRPAVPMRYCDEVWTGVEYQVGAHCFMENLFEEGISIVRAVRRRYDGTRRNPYNEVECGDHYARAMSGWSLLEAVSGVRWDGARRRVTIGDRVGRFPFVAGHGWGVIEITRDAVRVRCMGGVIDAAEFRIQTDEDLAVLPIERAIAPGDEVQRRRSEFIREDR
jgi:non-lysosomal glucosylceramidase